MALQEGSNIRAVADGSYLSLMLATGRLYLLNGSALSPFLFTGILGVVLIADTVTMASRPTDSNWLHDSSHTTASNDRDANAPELAHPSSRDTPNQDADKSVLDYGDAGKILVPIELQHGQGLQSTVPDPEHGKERSVPADGPSHPSGKGTKIMGLSRRVFFGIVVLCLVIIIAAAVGGGVGGTASSRAHHDKPAVDST